MSSVDLSHPQNHVAFTFAALPRLTMEQMLHAISEFFSRYGYRYTAPAHPPNEVTVDADDFPTFVVRVNEKSHECSIHFVDERKTVEFMKVEVLYSELLAAHNKPKKSGQGRPKCSRSAHKCLPPPPPPQPSPAVPAGSARQKAEAHGGITIEAMLEAVTAVLDKYKYTYELPAAYTNAMPQGFVPECKIEPHHESGYKFPPIVFHEAHRDKYPTTMSPPEKNTSPAFIIWHGLGRSVTSIYEITEYMEKGHNAFVDDMNDVHYETITKKVVDAASLETFIRKTMSNAAEKVRGFKPTAYDALYQRIHAAAVDALKDALPLRHATAI